MASILVVEDDETTANYVVGGLEQAGFVVDRAVNGRDGLFHATDGKYAAIVLDRLLPGMDADRAEPCVVWEFHSVQRTLHCGAGSRRKPGSEAQGSRSL